MKYIHSNILNINNRYKGFNLIEIIISIALLSTVFTFCFYFISTINIHKNNINNKPYLIKDFNYSNKYCDFNDNQLDVLSITKIINMGEYISSSTIITSMNIFNKNKLILTTNSASTTEDDIFIFDINFNGGMPQIKLRSSYDIGPGINDSILHDNFLYLLNTSANSHLKTFKIDLDFTLKSVSDLKIDSLSQSYSIPKKIYLYNKNIFIGSEKNNSGGELFLIPLNDENIPYYNQISLEIGGQVNDIFENQGLLYIANASDIELLVYDESLNKVYEYNAPLSLGNGKSVYFFDKYIYLGRTVASYEIFLLEVRDFILDFINKYKAYGTVDFIQEFGKNLLIISSSEYNELNFYSKKMSLIKSVNLPSRVNSFTCFNNNILISNIINNQSNIVFLK